MADLATLQARLAEAEQARHDVGMGRRAHLVMRDGRRMQFTEENLATLTAYIGTLRNEVAQAEADADGTPRRRAIGTVW